MFKQFTDRARQAMVLAQEEARILSHSYIGTEHILLGLLREQEGVAGRVLASLDITIERVRIVGFGEEVISGEIPFTPRSKKVLELALREAPNGGHSSIGTEHILLGLVREGQGVAMRVLLYLDADAERIRHEVTRMIAASSEPAVVEPSHARAVAPARTSQAFIAWLGRALVSTAADAQGDGERPVDGGDFLLALAREPNSVAARALGDLGIDPRAPARDSPPGARSRRHPRQRRHITAA